MLFVKTLWDVTNRKGRESDENDEKEKLIRYFSLGKINDFTHLFENQSREIDRVVWFTRGTRKKIKPREE